MDDSMDFGPQRKSHAGRYILIGCGGVLVIALVALVITGVWVANNWKDWAASGVTEIMANGIRDTQLTNEQKRQLIARVELMGDEFRAGRLSFEDLEKIGTTMQESPLIPVAIVEGLNAAYISPSDLTEAEKARAFRLNQRLARGVFEGRITLKELEPALQKLSKDGDAEVRVSETEGGATTGFSIKNIKDAEQMTVEDLRAYMADAESLLEQKAIPDEPFEVDIIGEFDKAIEAAIGRRLVPGDTGGRAEFPPSPDGPPPVEPGDGPGDGQTGG